MAQLDRYFQAIVKIGASDLHLAENQPPKARLHGRLVPLANQPLAGQLLEKCMSEVCPPDRWAHFLETRDVDFAHAFNAGGMMARFRVNFLRQIHGLSAVFRMIPSRIKTLEELNLPPVLKTFAKLRSGLVLVTGPTGSGKSTTLAALMNYINANYVKHIVTIEEPIEFVHENIKSLIVHREVGIDVNSFEDGLRTISRQDCDIVLVGELREAKTMGLALQAASRGVLVFATLHTNSASKTIDRIVDAFPKEEQPQVRGMLADNLKGVVAQLLLRTPDGNGRCATHEILIGVPALASIIRDANTAGIRNLIVSGKKYGMQLMDDNIWQLLQSGRVSGEDAYMKAQDKMRFSAYLPK